MEAGAFVGGVAVGAAFGRGEESPSSHHTESHQSRGADQGADPGADTAVVSRREARVACAGDAGDALRKMAAEPAIASAMRSRGSGLAASLLAASRDEGLDRNVRDTMGEAHALLIAGEGK